MAWFYAVDLWLVNNHGLFVDFTIHGKGAFFYFILNVHGSCDESVVLDWFSVFLVDLFVEILVEEFMFGWVERFLANPLKFLII